MNVSRVRKKVKKGAWWATSGRWSRENRIIGGLIINWLICEKKEEKKKKMQRIKSHIWKKKVRTRILSIALKTMTSWKRKVQRKP